MTYKLAMFGFVSILSFWGMSTPSPIDHYDLEGRRTVCQDPINNFPETGLSAIRDDQSLGGHQKTLRHAWNLLEQLSQETAVGIPSQSNGTIFYGSPVWEGWYTKCSELRLSRNCPVAITPLGGQKFRSESTTEHSDAGPRSNPQFSTVYYSPEIANWILINKLNIAAALFQQFSKQPAVGLTAQAPAVIVPAAPDESIVVKEIWEAINPSGDTWTLNVYDPDEFKNLPPGDPLPPINQWVHKVHLQTSVNKEAASLDTTTPCPPNSQPLGSGDLIAANCLVYRYAPQFCYAIRPTNLPPDSSTVDTNHPCLFALVGVQIMTRESLSNWTWSTFWWTANPGGFAEGRDPSALGPGFKNFAMATMLSPDGNPDELTNVPRLFNPYLEGIVANGRNSNCLRCHYQASYIPKTKPGPNELRNGSPIGQLVGDVDNQSVGVDCTSAQMTLPARNDCKLRTSFLWSLATNQDITAQVPFHSRVPFHLDITK